MATKKFNQNAVIAIYLFSAALAVVFNLYHYLKLRNQYLTGPQVRQVFDIGSPLMEQPSQGENGVGYGSNNQRVESAV